MANLIRLKQIDKPEFSGYVEQIGDAKYYLQSNPSGYISSISGDSYFLQLSGDVSSLSGDFSSDLATTGQTLSTNLNSTGQTLDTKIDTLSGYVEDSNADIATVSGNVNTAQTVSTGYAFGHRWRNHLLLREGRAPVRADCEGHCRCLLPRLFP